MVNSHKQSSSNPAYFPAVAGKVEAVERRFQEALRALHTHNDRFFAALLVAQWLACVVVALTRSPLTWAGRQSGIHPHVWAAFFLGGAIVILPAWLGRKHPGEKLTRHLLAISQMMVSALLIHLTDGRIETHFHVFGSLAFLAFYRDIRVLLSASAVVFVDHLVRGALWPQSVYGVAVSDPWRPLEHAFWVLFEVTFLGLAIRRSLGEMKQVAERQVMMEDLNGEMERVVQLRTKELALTEERFRSLFENVPTGLFRAAPSGELLLANPSFARLLGFNTPAEMIAARLNLKKLERSTEEDDLFTLVAKKGEVPGVDVAWRRPDGEKVFVRVSVKACESGPDEETYLEGSAEDITERRLLEERYLQAQKVQAIGQLAGGVAHDFNNILTAIIGYSDMILRRGSGDERLQREIEEIKKAGERAAGLTHQLLAFSRKQTLEPRTFQLNTVVADMEKMLRRLVGEHIAIRTVAHPELGKVKADIGQVQQVLMNLVVNARDAMPGGGTLTLETANVVLDAEYARTHPDVTAGDYVMLAVSDNGTGMSPEVMSRIFEPFFTTKEPGHGTGLGLATCHGIIKQSGGHISVYSEIGHGTAFKVYLPRTLEAESVDVAASPAPSLLRGSEAVLLVEDEPVVRELGKLVLTSLGYQVWEANNGREAIEKVLQRTEDPFHLVVTDVVMPEMGGRELADRLREISPQTRVLYSSGYTYDAIAPTDLLEKGTRFLQKPYTMATLASLVREVLDTTATEPGVN